MNKAFLISCFFLLSFKKTDSPLPLSWQTLQAIEFEDKYIQEVKGYMLFPKFTADIKKLENKQVAIAGYVVPIDKTGSIVALSANAYAACFFCGKAGPASVLTVKLKKPNKKYQIDQWITFVGKLKLNNDDIHEFYYILEDAEQQ